MKKPFLSIPKERPFTEPALSKNETLRSAQGDKLRRVQGDKPSASCNQVNTGDDDQDAGDAR